MMQGCLLIPCRGRICLARPYQLQPLTRKQLEAPRFTFRVGQNEAACPVTNTRKPVF